MDTMKSNQHHKLRLPKISTCLDIYKARDAISRQKRKQTHQVFIIQSLIRRSKFLSNTLLWRYMAAVTSVSAGSSLQHRFHSITSSCYSSTKESVTYGLATTVSRRFSLRLSYYPSTLRIRNAATKPAKSPGTQPTPPFSL